MRLEHSKRQHPIMYGDPIRQQDNFLAISFQFVENLYKRYNFYFGNKQWNPISKLSIIFQILWQNIFF
jgi:hypothetical protein